MRVIGHSSTITSREQISCLFQRGRRYQTAGITFIFFENHMDASHIEGIEHDPSGRVAFIAGKKQGNAVWRNGAKRRMRAVFADAGVSIQGYDLVFLARKRILELPYEQVLSSCRHALQKISLGE